jgi:hypothetical protein
MHRNGWLVLVPAVLGIGTTAGRSHAPRAAASDAPRAATLPVAWVKFEDPLEHAFTPEVPQGWTGAGWRQLTPNQ